MSENKPITPEERELLNIKKMSRQIKDKEQLRVILHSALPHLRKGVFDTIKPHLKFKCPEYRVVMRYE